MQMQCNWLPSKMTNIAKVVGFHKTDENCLDHTQKNELAEVDLLKISE